MSITIHTNPHATVDKWCGAKTRAGGTCKQTKGSRTDHPGQGRCWLHGGRTPIKHGRYSTITRPRILELVQAFDVDREPLNLLPEVSLLRALTIDYVERYDEMTEALLAWHASFELRRRAPATMTDALRRLVDTIEAEWSEVEGGISTGRTDDLALVRQLADVLEDPEDLGRPRRIMDIIDVAQLVEKVGKMVERIEKQTSDVTMHPEFTRITREMAKHVVANVPDDAARLRILQGWSGIPRQGKAE